MYICFNIRGGGVQMNTYYTFFEKSRRKNIITCALEVCNAHFPRKCGAFCHPNPNFSFNSFIG